jgi:hypothetical protein
MTLAQPQIVAVSTGSNKQNKRKVSNKVAGKGVDYEPEGGERGSSTFYFEAGEVGVGHTCKQGIRTIIEGSKK